MTHLANTLERTQALSLVPAPFEHSIAQLDAHSLLDQDRAALMTRVDDKYVIKRADLPLFLKNVKNDFTVLQDHELRVFPYQTVYYDTDDYQLYHQHHSGKANRIKVRSREYMHTGLAFFEIKQKNNKGITHKFRHQISENNSAYHLMDSIHNHGIKQTLTPALEVYYQRITLLHKSLSQRITIDLNLNYHDVRNNKMMEINDIIIIEIKRDRYDHQLSQSDAHKSLKKIGYSPINFSKYCMGCLLTKIPNIKINRFKQNIHYLKKHFSIEVEHAAL